MIVVCSSSWIAALLDRSHEQKTLHLIDIYDIHPEYESIPLTDCLENNWFEEQKKYPNAPSLVRATIRTLRWKPLMIGSIVIPKVNLLCAMSSLDSTYKRIKRLYHLVKETRRSSSTIVDY
jgi:hypothetical protein